ncbi:MAG: CrcB family protein [Trueperaceae bacterium]|nr:CrcB family protein [Truepera sp.]HRN17954.1 CrcB family protein [Trueperaceae bacterium]HRQ10051.1 CrcB family protein [Trueperaceae bacterium]
MNQAPTLNPLTAFLSVAAGGGVGSALRYGFALWLEPISRGFPFSMLVVNVLGSFAIVFFGELTVGGAGQPATQAWRLAALVGVCGGFTTFSSFSLQTVDLLRAGFVGRALANALLSVVLCVAAAALAYWAAARLTS